MTAHDHATFVEGCFRCILSRDELHDAHYPALVERTRKSVVKRLMRDHRCDVYANSNPCRACSRRADMFAEELGAVLDAVADDLREQGAAKVRAAVEAALANQRRIGDSIREPASRAFMLERDIRAALDQAGEQP